MENGNRIVRVTTADSYVDILLANGVTVTLASNPNSLHVHLSVIDLEQPVQVEDQFANQMNIKYKPRVP